MVFTEVMIITKRKRISRIRVLIFSNCLQINIKVSYPSVKEDKVYDLASYKKKELKVTA